ncbi:MAG: ADP-ribosylation factor-like protein [Planctomycetota bacterium]
MVQLNLALREINCKIVYFGCGLGGKTTNLEVVHQKADPGNRGELTSIATESDRTLFFDFMPLDLGEVSGMKVKFQLYTVPGQVYYNSTRKLVLRGADAVIFVADSQPSKMDENVESLDNLEECLREQGRSLAEMPHVIQFNKRDIEGALPVEEMSRVLNRHGAPTMEGVASRGEGVTETLKAVAGLLLEKVKAMSTDSRAKPDQKARRDAASIRTPIEASRPVTDRERLLGGTRGTQTPAGPMGDSNLASRMTPLGATPASALPPVNAHATTARSPQGPVPVAAPAAAVKPSVRAAAPERAAMSSSPHATRSIMVSSSSRRRGSGAATKIIIGLVVVAAAAAAAWYFLLR